MQSESLEQCQLTKTFLLLKTHSLPCVFEWSHVFADYVFGVIQSLTISNLELETNYSGCGCKLGNKMQMSIILLRSFLWVWSLPVIAHADENLLRAISQPGVIILMRHAQTDPGIGDPPGFQIDDCKTQRNLSQQGIAQARSLGRWLEQHELHPQRVRSSQWCRCIDTAHAAFGHRIKVTPWSALNSFFQGHGDRMAQLKEARETALGTSSGFEVWVTHQVVISALTNKNLAMGEFLVIKAQSNGFLEVLGRGQVN